MFLNKNNETIHTAENCSNNGIEKFKSEHGWKYIDTLKEEYNMEDDEIVVGIKAGLDKYEYIVNFCFMTTKMKID